MSGRIQFLPETNVTAISPSDVIYQDASGTEHTVENDYVFVFIGGVLPTTMLQDLGVEIDKKFGEPLMLR